MTYLTRLACLPLAGAIAAFASPALAHMDPAEHGSVLEEQRTILDEILCRQVEMSKTIKLGSPPAPSRDQPHQEHRDQPHQEHRGAKPDSNDFASYSYRELQIELKRRGLKASGTAAALRRRLQTSGME